jgi:hypothetical protein
MSRDRKEICQARIDIPVGSLYVYFFVLRDNVKWGEWWGRFFDYLTSLTPTEQNWQYDAEEDVYIARPQLNQEQRGDLLRFLRTAPPEEVNAHRTLRRAVEMTTEQEERFKLVYFSGGVRELKDDS